MLFRSPERMRAETLLQAGARQWAEAGRRALRPWTGAGGPPIPPTRAARSQRSFGYSPRQTRQWVTSEAPAPLNLVFGVYRVGGRRTQPCPRPLVL